MKHRPIIQENLDKETTKKGKILYLMYAYKEWLIGLGLTLVILFIFVFSMLATQKPDLSVRIISDQPVTIETLDHLSTFLQESSEDEILIDVQNYLVDNMDQQQILMAQMVAKEVDLFVIPNDSGEKVTSLVNEMIDEQNVFSLDGPLSDYTVSTAINAPHEEQISFFKKALSSN